MRWAAFAAMALAIILGPRTGKYDEHGNPRLSAH